MRRATWFANAATARRTGCSLRHEKSTVYWHRSPVALRSGFNLTAFGVTLVITTAGLLILQTYNICDTPEITADPSNQPQIVRSSELPPVRVYPGMVAEIPPGRPGNLTPDQEAKLRELWQLLFQLTGAWPHEDANVKTNGRGFSPPPSQITEVPEEPGSSGKKKRRFGNLLGRKKDKDSKDESDATSEYSVASAADDKHGQAKEFKEALSKMSAAELRRHLWEFSKADDPDANLCRYLRARKWNVHDAMVMLISTIHWRSQVMLLDEDIMRNGEEAAVEASKNNPGAPMDKKLGEDFIAQLRMGKSFLHGTDKEGRPMCFVRVRLHRQGEQSEAALERYTVYTIETARFMLRPPVDTAVIVFDMTNFSMANMDYSPVKFMIKVFEANYPESLGHVFVHKAPWLFQGIWTVIRGWLDPVVASKVHFTRDVNDLSRFVDMDKIPKELGGEEDWEYQYQEPITGENEAMKDEEAKAEIEKERSRIVDEYEAATVEWIRGDSSKSAGELHETRLALAESLRKNYWKLDPFIRAKSLYDRRGIIREGGIVNMYPKENGQATYQQKGGGSFGLLSAHRGIDQKDADEKSIKSVYYDAKEDQDLD